jgi:hypothetical protein
MMLPFHLGGTTDRLEEQPSSHLEVQTATRIAQVVDLIIGWPTSLAIGSRLPLKINDIHDVKGSNAQKKIAE